MTRHSKTLAHVCSCFITHLRRYAPAYLNSYTLHHTHTVSHSPLFTHHSPLLTTIHHHSPSLIYHSVLTHPSLTTHLPLIPHSLALTSSSPLLAFALIDPRYNPIDISLGNPSHPVDISPNNLVRCTSHSVHCTLYSSRGNMPHLE